MDTMLEHQKIEIAPALFKIDEFKEYRKVVGTNLARNKVLAQQSSLRSESFSMGNQNSAQKP